MNNLVGVPVGTVTYSLLAFTTVRLPTEVDLLAIGDLIVHLLTGSFVYVPRHPEGSIMYYMHQMRLNGCVRWCHYIASVNDSHYIEVNRIYVDDVNGHITQLYPLYNITFVSLISLVSLVFE